MDGFNTLLDSLSAQIALLLVLSGTVERLTEYVKLIITAKYKQEIPAWLKQVLVLVVSIAFCVLSSTQFNVGLAIPTVANQIIAGILVSFGSDTLHALLNVIKSIKDTNEAKTSVTNSSTHDDESVG
jgi:hypothetical protein